MEESTTSNTSLVRQNFHKLCEDAINKQINTELYASYVYLSMAYYFDRDDVALPGLHSYFKKQSDEENQHAKMFMEYMNKRGGRITLIDIKAPEKNDWGSALEAMQASLDFEKHVNENIFQLHTVANEHNDVHLSGFLEENFLTEQVDSIKEFADNVTRLTLLGDGVGVFLFDKEIGKN